MTGFRNKLHLPHALHKTMVDFYSLAQGKHRSNQEYLDEFNSMVITAEESGATIGTHPGGVTEALKNGAAVDADNPTDPERDAAIKSTTDRYLAVAFLLGADRFRYGTLVEEIENEYLRNKGGSNSAGTYPTTVAEAYDYLCNYKKDPKNLTRLLGQNHGNDFSTGVAFAQDGGRQNQANETPGQASLSQEQAFATTGGAGNYASRKTICRRCGADGHNSIDCDSPKEKVDIYRQSQQANQGVSQLIHAVDWDGAKDGIGNKAENWVCLQKAVIFKGNGPIRCTEHDKNGSMTHVHKSTIFSQANSGIPST